MSILLHSKLRPGGTLRGSWRRRRIPRPTRSRFASWLHPHGSVARAHRLVHPAQHRGV